MRVLHINANYSTSALHQTMLEHLNTLGINNSVYAPTFDINRTTVDCKDYVTISECFKKRDRFFYFRKQKKIIESIEKNYLIEDFDIIHAYTLFTDGNAAMALYQKYGVPYVVAIRNTDLNVFFKKMIHLRSHGVKILKNAKAIFFLSPVYRDFLVENYIPSNLKKDILGKTHIIPNGIDDYWHDHKYERNTEEFEIRIKKSKTVNCIYVGNIDKNKNVELTLRALESINSSGWNCNLTSVGKIVNKNVYKGLCRYAFFRYVEPKSKEALINFYRSADVFVMPSHTETFGLVYAEAMSQSLPVIYTRGQGFDGQFREGKVGYSVDDNNVQDVVERLKDIIANYRTISTECAKMSDKFTWNTIVNKYFEIYQEIINYDG